MCSATRSSLRQLLTVAVVLCTGTGVAVAQDKTTTPAKPATAAKKPSIYDKSADAAAQIEKAKETARHDDKRILVMFGGDWCGWCHKLHELFASDAAGPQDPELRICPGHGRHPGPRGRGPARKVQGGPEPGRASEGIRLSFPERARLRRQDRQVAADRSLEEGDHHDPGRVKEFLSKWTVTAKDAEIVLRDGLSRASSEDKRVFLKFGAPWCGWCHKLDDWMAQPEIAAILDRDFVTVRVDIDRMTHGKEVLHQFRPSDRGRHSMVRRSGLQRQVAGNLRRARGQHRLPVQARGDRPLHGFDHQGSPAHRARPARAASAILERIGRSHRETNEGPPGLPAAAAARVDRHRRSRSRDQFSLLDQERRCPGRFFVKASASCWSPVCSLRAAWAQNPGAGGQPAPKRRPFAKPGAPRQEERIRYFDVKHVKAELTLATKQKEVRGTVTHTLSPLHPYLTRVELDCAPSSR